MRQSAAMQRPADFGGATPRVSVVLPTLNEAANLPHVIPELPSDIFELIIVDGGSSDGTAEVALKLYPAAIVVRQSGTGKGDALNQGFAACNGDIIVAIDGDGSTSPREIPRFVEALVGGADFVKGSRFLPGGGSDDLSRLRRAGNRALTDLVNVLFGTRYSDLCYGFNAFWADYAGYVAGRVNGFEIETAMNVRAAKAGLTVVEVPSWEGARLNGTGKLRTFRDGWRVLKTIVRERFTRTPEQPSLAETMLAEAAARARD